MHRCGGGPEILCVCFFVDDRVETSLLTGVVERSLPSLEYGTSTKDRI